MLLCGLLALVKLQSSTIGGSNAKKQSGSDDTTKKSDKCKEKRGDCAYTQRRLVNGKWKCPAGYEDTNCTWSDGKEKGALQCRACGQYSPYAAYEMSNPNCPAGFQPCNDKKFNYGDLKKNSKGEYYYEPGWGVDDKTYNWAVDGANPVGGDISLNIGKWGGTDAHPEVFAKGCCAWGNSTDDPERDKANKKIKILTSAISGVIDVAAIIAAPFTGGGSLAGSLALHGAASAVSTGVSAGGQAIRATCGGPTERYKATGRNYLFKGPYKDGSKMRGTPGIWYTANDGCPLKWLQYIPPGS